MRQDSLTEIDSLAAKAVTKDEFDELADKVRSSSPDPRGPTALYAHAE